MSAHGSDNGRQSRQAVARAVGCGPGAAAAAAGGMGIAVLAGWWLGLPGLSGGVGDWAPVSPDTAIAVLLLALGLRLSEPGVRWPHARLVADASAVAALVVAAAVVAELCAVVPFTPGDLAVPAALDARALQAGRMSLATLIDVVALALAVLMRNWTTARGWRPAPVVALAVLVVSSDALLAVAFGVPAFSGLTPLAPQTSPAAAAFALLAAGFVLALEGRRAIEALTRHAPTSILIHRMAPAAIIVPVALGWIRLHAERRGVFTHEFGVALMVTVTVVMMLGMTWLTALTLDASEEVRRRTEKAERESRDRLRHAVRAGHVGLFEWDLVTGRVWYSPEWKRQIGYDEGEIGDAFAEWQTRVHPDDEEAVTGAIRAYLGGREPDFQAEFRFRHKDGSYRRFLARATEVRGPDGARVKLVGSHVDITEYANLQAQLQQSYRMESLGRLAGGVAHDFNNLLSIVTTATDLLIEDLPQGGYMRDTAQAIREAAARAAVLTGQLLAFSRQQVVAPRVLDLREVVTGFEGMLRRLLREDIRLAIHTVPGSAKVKADRGQIEQVILNLAVNAQDAMPDGGVLAIAVREMDVDERHALKHPELRPGPHAALEVRDTGEGMSEATRARIFEPFFTTKGPGKGTGLGLATVYGIVKQSGGAVEVESEIGGGSTFTICLPREAGPVEPPRREATASVGGGETVLVIEDEAVLRRMVVRTLDVTGYKTLDAETGEQALKVLASHAGAVDLMLSDVVLPGMASSELASRATQLRPEMALLYMSGYVEDPKVQRALRGGTVPFLAKPFTRSALTRAVREALDKRR